MCSESLWNYISKSLSYHYLIIFYYATQQRHRCFLGHFYHVYLFAIEDELMNYNLKWVFWIMPPFKMLINNNNGSLGDWSESKCKFILSQPSLQIPFVLHFLSNQYTYRYCQCRMKKYDYIYTLKFIKRHLLHIFEHNHEFKLDFTDIL